MSYDHLWMAYRGMHVRAVVQAIDDTGGEQVVSAQAHAGGGRSQIPVHQPFGFSSHAPLDGAVTHVVAVGGDHADLVALPPANPSVARFGALAEGETVMYDAWGQRIHMIGGKIVAIDAAQELQVNIGGALILDLTAKGAQLNVPLSVKGTITATEDITTQGDVKTATVSLNEHPHGGVTAGSDQSGPPAG
ncbi:phage baseplate assembly protein [Komagataeibacter xylinus]|uniref:phage baseplate assembly protein domain-containing protein n=1 Tax=Komagataeibacter xylinus TaxID=28448 RepID=UPI00280BC58B|nr:phage baseplate assembly protein [Komagataeibacter xylinus]